MEKTIDGGAWLDANEIDGVLSLILAEQMRVVDIRSTTWPAINILVAEWERVIGPIPKIYR